MKTHLVLNPNQRALAAAGVVAVFVLLWYFRPYPWLGVAMCILAGFLTYSILHSGRIERWRRSLLIALAALASLTLLAYAMFLGTASFMASVRAWHSGYFFASPSSIGAMPFPTPIVMPAIFWSGSHFLPSLGVWQTAVPTSLWASLIFMMPMFVVFVVFGRGFCGWLCPLGGLPEAFAAVGQERWLLSALKERRVSGGGVSYRVPRTWVHMVRYGFLAGIFMLSLLFSFSLVNIFYPVLWLKSIPVFWTVTGIMVVFAVALPMVTKRRWWCYICPVGAALSLIEKVSLFRLNINQEKCNHCLDCVRSCRYYALDPQSIEKGKCHSEFCVKCGRCIEACSEEAIDITWLGGRFKAREPFIALIISLAFAFYTWFAVQLTYLLSNVSDFKWLT